MGCRASQCFSTMESSATVKADPGRRRRDGEDGEDDEDREDGEDGEDDTSCSPSN